MEPRSAAKFRWRDQAFHHLAVLEVRFDDFVDVRCVHIGVPGALGVDHGHGAARAAVQATGLVHTHLAGTRQPGGLDLGLAAVKTRLSVVVGAAVFTVGALQ